MKQATFVALRFIVALLAVQPLVGGCAMESDESLTATYSHLTGVKARLRGSNSQLEEPGANSMLALGRDNQSYIVTKREPRDIHMQTVVPDYSSHWFRPDADVRLFAGNFGLGAIELNGVVKRVEVPSGTQGLWGGDVWGGDSYIASYEDVLVGEFDMAPNDWYETPEWPKSELLIYNRLKGTTRWADSAYGRRVITPEYVDVSAIRGKNLRLLVLDVNADGKSDVLTVGPRGEVTLYVGELRSFGQRTVYRKAWSTNLLLLPSAQFAVGRVDNNATDDLVISGPHLSNVHGYTVHTKEPYLRRLEADFSLIENMGTRVQFDRFNSSNGVRDDALVSDTDLKTFVLLSAGNRASGYERGPIREAGWD